MTPLFGGARFSKLSNFENNQRTGCANLGPINRDFGKYNQRNE